MEAKVITPEVISDFRNVLNALGRSVHTVARYLFDVTSFARFLDGREATSEATREFRDSLMSRGYAPGSVNTKLASLFSFFHSLGWEGCETPRVLIQKDAYISEDAELTLEDYRRLLAAARCPRDRLILETLGGTGIRVSELRYFTLEAVRNRDIRVQCKRKIRRIMIPETLGRQLEDYAAGQGITSGVIFRREGGGALDRIAVWRLMKAAGRRAGLLASKVHPHNLRKLFARTFLENGGTLEQLCDVLGHSSMETTRIYIKTSGAEHRRIVEGLGLVPCQEDEPEAEPAAEPEETEAETAEAGEAESEDGEKPETAAPSKADGKPHGTKKPFPRRKNKRRKGKKAKK